MSLHDASDKRMAAAGIAIKKNRTQKWDVIDVSTGDVIITRQTHNGARSDADSISSYLTWRKRRDR